jgi:hypothetical protein
MVLAVHCQCSPWKGFSMNTTLQLTRSFRVADLARPYHIVLDGEAGGRIGTRGEPPGSGPHSEREEADERRAPTGADGEEPTPAGARSRLVPRRPRTGSQSPTSKDSSQR